VTGTLKTHAVLDLGVSSLQTVFEFIGYGNRHDVHADVFGKNYTIRSQSIPCFGMDQARLRHQLRLIQENKRNPDRIPDPCMPNGSKVKVSGERLINFCLNIVESNVVGYKGPDEKKTYTFFGMTNVFECQSHVRDMLSLKLCNAEFQTCFERAKSEMMSSMKLIAISGFCDLATILKNVKDGSISLDDFEREGNDICNSIDSDVMKYHPNVRVDMVDEYCFRHQYIQHILKLFFQIPEGKFKDIMFTKTINDQPLDWTLGLMINATNLLEKSTKPTPILPFPVFIILLILSFIAAVGGVACAVLSTRVKTVSSLGLSASSGTSVNAFVDTGSNTITDSVMSKHIVTRTSSVE
jgi:hypothetical protein